MWTRSDDPGLPGEPPRRDDAVKAWREQENATRGGWLRRLLRRALRWLLSKI